MHKRCPLGEKRIVIARHHLPIRNEMRRQPGTHLDLAEICPLQSLGQVLPRLLCRDVTVRTPCDQRAVEGAVDLVIGNAPLAQIRIGKEVVILSLRQIRPAHRAAIGEIDAALFKGQRENRAGKAILALWPTCGQEFLRLWQRMGGSLKTGIARSVSPAITAFSSLKSARARVLVAASWRPVKKARHRYFRSNARALPSSSSPSGASAQSATRTGMTTSVGNRIASKMRSSSRNATVRFTPFFSSSHRLRSCGPKSWVR